MAAFTGRSAAIGSPWTVNREGATTARRASLDMVRGLAVIAVVLFHEHLFLRDKISEPAWLWSLNETLSIVRIPTLMLISGIVSHSLLTAEAKRARNRIAGVFWLFVVWMPVYMAVCKLSPLEMIISPGGEVWYVWALALCMALLYSLRNFNRTLIIIPVLTVSLLVYYAKLIPHGYAQAYGLRYSMFFFVGALYRNELLTILSNRYAKAALIIGTAGSFLISRWLPAPFQVVMVALSAIAVCQGLADRNVPGTRFLGTLGQNTLPIYIMHGLWIRVIKHLLPVPISSPIATAALMLVTMPVVIVACLAIRRWCESNRLNLMFAPPWPSRQAGAAPVLAKAG